RASIHVRHPPVLSGVKGNEFSVGQITSALELSSTNESDSMVNSHLRLLFKYCKLLYQIYPLESKSYENRATHSERARVFSQVERPHRTLLHDVIPITVRWVPIMQPRVVV